jgi:hypothetical protein
MITDYCDREAKIMPKSGNDPDFCQKIQGLKCGVIEDFE